MRWCLALLVFLARVAGCDGDAPTLSARVERVGALTFVVAMNVSAPGEVDIVATRASEYPDWGSASAPPSLADLRAAVALGGAISTATDPPPAYFRRTVRVPAANLETRVLVRGAYNLQRPERSGAYGDFVVYPGSAYVVAAAARDDADGTAQVTALEAVTAASVSSDASLARFGVVVSATTAGVVDAAASASSTATATLAPTFDAAGGVRRLDVEDSGRLCRERRELLSHGSIFGVQYFIVFGFFSALQGVIRRSALLTSCALLRHALRMLCYLRF